MPFPQSAPQHDPEFDRMLASEDPESIRRFLGLPAVPDPELEELERERLHGVVRHAQSQAHARFAE